MRRLCRFPYSFTFSILLVYPMLSVAENRPTICDVEKFVSCMNTNISSCKKSLVSAEKVCLEKYPIDSTAHIKDAKKLAEKYSQCYLKEFTRGINNNLEKFEECGVYLKAMFDEIKNDPEAFFNKAR